MPLVVIGLGNPGEEYGRHRHNIGFQVIDRLGEDCTIKLKASGFFHRYEIGKGRRHNRTLVLVKPLTFMNRSGEIVKIVLRESKASLEDLLVVYDSLDLETGALKLKRQGSSGGHRGLESVIRTVKTNEFMRFAIGIGRPAYKSDVVDYVLGEPDQDEARALADACGRAVAFIVRLLREPGEKVMGDVNRRNKPDDHAER